MKKILLLALPLMVMCAVSCKKENLDSRQGFSIWQLWDYEYASDEWQGDPIKAFGDSEKSVYIQAQTYSGNQYDLPQFTWSVSCDKDWCHYEYSGGSSLLTLRFTCDDNTTGNNRTAILTVNAGEQSLQIGVEQLGTPSVTVSTPGTLTQELANKDLLYSTSLKISGKLNDKDLETIKGLREVETLDLTEVIIDDLPDEMYYRNETIKSIKLPKSITTIHPKTFTYSSLEYVYMPANIVKIEDGGRDNSNFIVIGAFSETPLRNVEFEKNSKLKYIGDGSFSGCGIIDKMWNHTLDYASLDITIPASVEHIGSLVFGDTHWYERDSGVYTNVNVNFEKESKLKYFGKESSLMNARGNYAVDCACGFNLNLENCKNIEYIGRIDASVLFQGSATVKIGNSIPPELAGTSIDDDTKSYLYVPEGCIGAYYDADGWKEFDIIEEIGQE